MEINKYKICNIALDEKFIDGAIECLDLLSDRWDSQWVVCQNVEQDLKMIKRYVDRIKIIPEKNVLDYINQNKFDAIILHSFVAVSPLTIIQIPKKIRVFWFGWGYDIYNFPEYRPFLKWNLYKPLTYRYINSSLSVRINQLVSKIIFFIKRKDKLFDKALNRIDFFSGILPFEYDLLKHNSKFRAQRVLFSYSSLAGLKSYENFERYDGNNILIGNSAVSTNNHLDLLEYLRQLDLEGKKIIMPLSYGGQGDYVKYIIKKYKEFLGDKLIPVVDFLPFDVYTSYIKSCSVAIFFMERQQAMGNIITALKYGCKVFLSDKNPVYKFYRDMGVSVFSVERDLNNENIANSLEESEIEKNRNIFKNQGDYNAYIKKLNTIYEALR
ncbi:MAG: TDP-N-acetylfucosamine:lipid II N-acetylfucosaminyltransferase [Bacteroidales bacterium]|nr:TDP-N-acetylfucosamine:lipid II N-acetylfucosaminyltransferase [Bacteroidales bacterium]